MSKLLKTNQFDRHFFIWKSFWLTVVSISSFYFILTLDKKILDAFDALLHLNLHLFIGICTISLLVFLGLIDFFMKPVVQLKKQAIHNQPSWVFYFYWGTINSLLLWSSFVFLTENREYWWNGFWKFGLILSLIIIILKWLNERITKLPNLSFKSFASGAVGIDDDRLNFKISAQNVATGLKKLDNYVNVVGLYGGLGFGKSSYARMIMESFDAKETLYTYISLTETNEAKDFSKLFAERWSETLAERYPKIDVASYLPFMQSIFRESGNGILSDILNILSTLNQGLVKTKAVIFDKFYGVKEKTNFTSSSVGKIFGNIPEIKESVWVIMVDEIERAQFDEIYRLVEIVERFKNEGRTGLPIKLLFIFCISEPEFGEYLKTFEKIDSRIPPLQTFFYTDPKSIIHRIFLPPIEPQLKQAYVMELLNKLIDRENIDVPKQISPHTIGDPSRSFISKHEEALGYIVGLLSIYSPRVISRTATALDFFYGSFRDRTGGLQKNAIRFSDIVTLEFIKIKYPYLIEFFLKTIHFLVAQTETHNVEGYLLKKEFEEKKINLIGWVENVTGRKLSDIEKEEVQKLIGLVMYYYFDFLTKDYDTKDKVRYSGTTSYPEIMHDYLSLVSESIETGYRKYSQIYQQHKNTKADDFLSNFDNKDLIGYARFLHDMWEASQDLNLDLINELSKRFLSGKIELKPMNVGDTVFDEAIYQFVFQILAATEKDKSKDIPDSGLQVVFNVLKKILNSSTINIGAKYIILNSLANNERGGASSIHQRLEEGFRKLMKYYEADIKKLIKNVFEDAEKRYFAGKRKQVIYKKEENFFYVLYQSWSGLKDAGEEISRIRNAAKRGLKNHPEAIRLYWSKYPIKEGWKDLDDAFRGDPFFSGGEVNNGLYMPLGTLITITKRSKIEDKEIRAKVAFWGGLMNDARLVRLFELKDDPATLKAVLLKRGLLVKENELKPQ